MPGVRRVDLRAVHDDEYAHRLYALVRRFIGDPLARHEERDAVSRPNYSAVVRVEKLSDDLYLALGAGGEIICTLHGAPPPELVTPNRTSSATLHRSPTA